MPGQYPHPMQSPGYGSPAMMPYGSPPRGYPPPGTPGRMPFMPPQQAYEQNSPARNVQQRRNPDGSTSIQIGGEAPAPAPTGEADEAFGEEQSNNNNEGKEEEEQEE